MSKITRATHAVFGINAGGSDIGIFGSLAFGSASYSNVIATIQSLPNWGSGWAAAIIATNRPALEDMNAYCYEHSYQVGYMLEMGIPEWDAGTTYYQNSYCQVSGVVYYSLQDTNLNKAPASQPTYWTAGLKGLTTIPTGIIVMWSGTIASIPSGWVLCDGANSTPDLRDRFIVGARQDDSGVAKTNVTGSLTQSGDGNIPAHTHIIGNEEISSTGGGTIGTPKSTGNLNSGIAGSGTKNIAVYYALAFIMKS